MNETVTVIDVVAQVTDDTASGAQSAARNVSRLEQSMTKLRSRIDGMKGKSKLEVRAEMRDMATSGIQRIASAGKKLAGKVWTVTLKAKDFVTAPFRKIAGLLRKHAELARLMGVSPRNVLITEIGRTVEFNERGARLGGVVPSGRVFVDGLGIGDVGATVLRDRRHLADDGLLVVVMTIDSTSGVVIAGPDIVSRGFIYVKEAEDLMEQLRTQCQISLDICLDEGIHDWNGIKAAIKTELSDYLFRKTKRSPMILPVIMEI